MEEVAKMEWRRASDVTRHDGSKWAFRNAWTKFVKESILGAKVAPQKTGIFVRFQKKYSFI